MLGHEDGVTALVWSPDGTRIASGGPERMIRLWDPISGMQCLALLAHEKEVRSLSWSPDGSRLLSSGGDGVIKIWGTTLPGRTM